MESPRLLAATARCAPSPPSSIQRWHRTEERTFTNVVAGAGVKTTPGLVAADSAPIHSEYTVIDDGKDNPITGNSRNGDVAAGTRVDANTVRFIYKKGETVTVTTTNVVSSDGKTYTVTAKGVNTLGQTINTVAVYDKQ